MRFAPSDTAPPHNFEAERWLLGAAMTDGTGDLARTLDWGLFDDPQHICLSRVLRTIGRVNK